MANQPKRILVIAAHPDDEILGVGATIAKHTANKDQVSVVIAAQGATSRYSEMDSDSERVKSEVSCLRECAKAAAKVLGTNEPVFLDFPDNQMDTCTLLSVVHDLENVIESVQPQIIYTHHGGDLNVDHQIVHRAALTACRPLPTSTIEAIYTYETLSSTEWYSAQQQMPFIANRYVEVSEFLHKKIQALQCYEKEMRPFPHPRSVEAIEALAKLRGANSGLQMAEAFQVCREVLK